MTVRVHWAQVINDLQRRGYSLRMIGDSVEAAESALRAAAYGDMRHATGERLVTLWMRETGCERDQLPLSDGLACEP